MGGAALFFQAAAGSRTRTLDEMLDDGEAEAWAAGFSASRGVYPVETLGQARQMLPGNSRAMIGDGNDDPASFAPRGDLDAGIGPFAAVAERIAQQIVEHLDELAAVAAHWTKVWGEVDGELAARAARIGDGRLDHFVDRDRLVRRDEAVGFDTREAHQILDDPQHPPRFVADGAAEGGTRLGRQILLVRQRFGIAEHRRERRAQLVAGIGNEIDTHLFCGDGFRPVSHPDEHAPVVELADRKAPRAAELSDPRDLNVAGDMAENMVECPRLPNGEPDVSSLDPRSQKLPGAPVRGCDDMAFDDQRRFVERVHECAFVGGPGRHVRTITRLQAISHERLSAHCNHRLRLSAK